MAENKRSLEQKFPQFDYIAEGKALLDEVKRLSRFDNYRVSDEIIRKAFDRVETLDEESIYGINTKNDILMFRTIELIFGAETVRKYKKMRSLRKPLREFLRNYATFRYFENHPDFKMENFMSNVGSTQYWDWYRCTPKWCIKISGIRQDNGEFGIWRTPMVRSRLEAMKQRFDLGKKYAANFNYQLVMDNNRGYSIYPVFPYPKNISK